jgi:hypothetical protein
MSMGWCRATMQHLPASAGCPLRALDAGAIQYTLLHTEVRNEILSGRDQCWLTIGNKGNRLAFSLIDR